MRVFLTGATGFVGSHLLRRLLALGHPVAVLMRPGSDPWRIDDVLPRVEVVEGDLSTVRGAAGAVRRFAPDVVVHLAWQAATSFKNADDPAQVFANVGGSLELVRLAGELRCRKWVGMGTVLESGSYAVPHPEDAPARPASLYGAAKHAVGLTAEHLCRVYGVEYAWFRLFWAYGPADDPARMIPGLIRALLKGECPRLTPGEQRWDYLYVDDAADAVARVAEAPGASGVFNLGSGRTTSIAEVARKVRDLIDPALPLGLGAIPYRPDQIMHLQADMTRLAAATGWSPSVGLDQGLERTVGWFRGHQARYAP